MEKILRYLPAFLILSLTIKSIITGASIGDALAILSLAGLMGYTEWMQTHKHPDPSIEFKHELDKLKTDVSKLNLILTPKGPANTPFRF
jgi:hypothetical protein